MILSLFILLEIVMITSFFIAFFTKEEIIWFVSLVLSGALMVTSYNVEIVTKGVVPTLTSYSFPFMMGINFMFFTLTLIYGLLDLYDKYGLSTTGFLKNKIGDK